MSDRDDALDGLEGTALAFARATLEHAVGLRPDEPTPPPGLAATHGVFVTLYHGGALRGCIGVTEASAPLHDLIPEMARAAAFEDPRFHPLAPEEVDEVRIELSLLTEPEPLPSAPDELLRAVRIGEHGLMVAGSGGRRGLLLPQVATEHGMDAAGFLGATCQKAGLPRDAWRATPERLRWRSFTTRVLREA